jgi:hypothetical protein
MSPNMTNEETFKNHFDNELGGGYDFSVASYSSSKNIAPVAGCYGWMAINKCDGIVFVNEIPLNGFVAPGLSGEAFAYVDNYRLYKGIIRLNMPLGLLTVTLVVIIQVYKTVN